MPREFFARPSVPVAPDLLGCVLEHQTEAGLVAVELTEVEAYAGASDPASHAYRGKTARNAVMFGPPGHAYVYFTYGMHFCVNLVCLGNGSASAVLLRAGRIIEGEELARARRTGEPRGIRGDGSPRKGKSQRKGQVAAITRGQAGQLMDASVYRQTGRKSGQLSPNPRAICPEQGDQCLPIGTARTSCRECARQIGGHDASELPGLHSHQPTKAVYVVRVGLPENEDEQNHD